MHGLMRLSYPGPRSLCQQEWGEHKAIAYSTSNDLERWVFYLSTFKRNDLQFSAGHTSKVITFPDALAVFLKNIRVNQKIQGILVYNQ